MLDIAFNLTGTLLASCSADATARVYSVAEGKTSAVLSGHTNSVNKVVFNPQTSKILTASEDATAKLWDLEGKELQTLSGHSDEIFSCAFNYEGDAIITGSKDNSCMLWKARQAGL